MPSDGSHEQSGKNVAWSSLLSRYALWCFAVAVLPGARAATAKPTEDPGHARAWSVTATAGFEIDRGISRDTDLDYFPFSIRLDYRNLSFTLATSWIEIDGPNLADDLVLPNRIQSELDAAGVTFADIVDTEPFDTSASGAGDTLASIAWAWVDPLGFWPYVEIEATLKIPTADEDRLLGTGHFDGIFSIELARSFGRVTPFASLSYRSNGGPLVLPEIVFEVPPALGGGTRTIPEERVSLRNTFSTTLGLSARAHERLYLGLMYDWAQSSVRSVGDTHELVPFLSIGISEHLRLGPYIAVGLSHEAPEIGYATQLVFVY